MSQHVDDELDLRRLANARMLRRVASFVLTGVGAAMLARYSGEIADMARVLANSQVGLQVREGMLFEFGFSLFALLILLHLLYRVGVLVWQWRTFVPMLESKKPEEAALALIRLTSVFALSQRTAQSRQLVGAAAVVVGFVRLFGSSENLADIEGGLVPLGLVVLGGTTMFISFWLRYGFAYSRTVLVPLLEAIVAAEASRLSDSEIASRVAEIVARVRKQKPWWFIRPSWFL